jgi:hypothetical protein
MQKESETSYGSSRDAAKHESPARQKTKGKDQSTVRDGTGL